MQVYIDNFCKEWVEAEKELKKKCISSSKYIYKECTQYDIIVSLLLNLHFIIYLFNKI